MKTARSVSLCPPLAPAAQLLSGGSSHATIFQLFLPPRLGAQPPAPNQRELRNRLLAQEQLLSKRFLIVCMEGKLGTALAPVMEPELQLPRPAEPPSPSWLPPPLRPGLGDSVISSTYRPYPPLCNVKPGTTKEGKREPYLSYAFNLFLWLPHAQRYVNAPSAPTNAPARPVGPGAWHSPMSRDIEGRGGRGAVQPCRGRKRQRRAVAQRKMRQRSKGQTARNRLVRESRNAQSPAGPALTIEEEAVRRRNPVRHGSEKGRKSPVEHRPLRRAGEIHGRSWCGEH